MTIMRNSKGFSLIEVMVTLVLTTIGILGMVAMQGRSIQYANDSMQRNTAVMLADNLLETIRANPQAVLDHHNRMLEDSDYYKAPATDFPSVEEGEEPTCAPLPANSAPADQLQCWLAQLQASLPVDDTILKDEIHICPSQAPGSCTAGSAIEIQLAWRTKSGECMDSSADADSDPTICRYRVRAEI